MFLASTSRSLQAAVAVIAAISAAGSTLAATMAGHSHRERFDDHCDRGYARSERYPAIAAAVLVAVATLAGAGDALVIVARGEKKDDAGLAA